MGARRAGDRLLMYAQLKEWAEKNFVSRNGIQMALLCQSFTASVKDERLEPVPVDAS